MKTLLEKIQGAEKEANEVVAQARRLGQEALTTIKGNEASMLENTGAHAHKKAKSVIAERVAAAKSDVNALKQEGEQALAAVREMAQKNHKTALKMTSESFRKLFLS